MRFQRLIPLILLVFAFIIGCFQMGGDGGYGSGNHVDQAGLKKFTSAEELREYLEKSREMGYYGLWAFGFVRTAELAVVPSALSEPTPPPIPGELPEKAIGSEYQEYLRYSTTNVQVAGVDEPDIVKTDGRNIYFSNPVIYKILTDIYPPPPVKSKTVVISAYPPENMSVSYEIGTGGSLLLENDILMVIGYGEVTAYRIGEDKATEMWKLEMNGTYVDARLYNGSLYLVTRTPVSIPRPCPIRPLSVNGEALTVRCVDIYYPVTPVYSDTTYTVAAINPENGEIKKSVTLIGSVANSVLYMSGNAIYLTYLSLKDPAEIYHGFIMENRDLFPDWVAQKVSKLREYDISSRAKMVEIFAILEQFLGSLNEDERKKVENELWNRMSDYWKEKGRDIERTIIVKFSMELEPVARGEVPGRLLNQFSLDEYNGYLRVATTVRTSTSLNDVYVLDSSLKLVGSLTDLGEGERIYAVRFIGDRGYVVTFRETDPLFVIDLSNPEKPSLSGELKIPGYSSYLHPISEDLLLGIGKEGNYVKISLFDISSPDNPVEMDKYILKEYWSDILQTHHAFLLDKKHEVFFLPAGSGGYIFSYADGLKIVKAVDMPAKRAVYIDDYMYIIGDSVVAIDENTWKEVREIKLQ
jgi:uncharacterized secreted protein with C-terminal beta-propeller domain